MPEGDTIFRAARRVGHALSGQTLTRFSSPRLPTLTGAKLDGTKVVAVEAIGKYLVVRFEDGRSLVTHMKMTGSWHVYRRGERWKRPLDRAQAILETASHVVICFDAPVVRLVSNTGGKRALAGLGPDLLGPSPDLAEATRRIREAPLFTIGQALLSQRLVAGIGNVIKSEALFIARVDPRAKVRDVPDDAILRALEEARKILVANVAPTMRGPRRTRSGASPVWVYRRDGAPCFVCKTKIERIYQGPLGERRSTYFCPSCVAAPETVARAQ